MLTRAMPCPECLCEDCNFFADDYSVDDLAENYEVLSGSWAIAGGLLDPPAGGTLLLEMVDPHDNGGVRLRIRGNFHGSTGTLRLLVDYIDADNYLSARLSSNGATDGQLRLFVNDGAYEEPLCDTTTVPGTITDFDWNRDFTLELCWDYARLRARFRQNTELKVAADVAELGGNRVGITTSGTGLTLDDLEFSQLRPGCPSCGATAAEEPCAEYVGSCTRCGNDVPKVIQVSVPDFDTCDTASWGSLSLIFLVFGPGQPVGTGTCTFSSAAHYRLVQRFPPLDLGSPPSFWRCCNWSARNIRLYPYHFYSPGIYTSTRTTPYSWERLVCQADFAVNTSAIGTPPAPGDITHYLHKRRSVYVDGAGITGFPDPLGNIRVAICERYWEWLTLSDDPIHGGTFDTGVPVTLETVSGVDHYVMVGESNAVRYYQAAMIEDQTCLEIDATIGYSGILNRSPEPGPGEFLYPTGIDLRYGGCLYPADPPFGDDCFDDESIGVEGALMAGDGKIAWTCPQCRVSVRLRPAAFPLICVCGREASGIADSGPPPAERTGPCQHLAAELRQQVCESCCGKVRIKVFGCELHGECTLAKPLPGLACCDGCADYRRADERAAT